MGRTRGQHRGSRAYGMGSAVKVVAVSVLGLLGMLSFWLRPSPKLGGRVIPESASNSIPAARSGTSGSSAARPVPRNNFRKEVNFDENVGIDDQEYFSRYADVFKLPYTDLTWAAKPQLEGCNPTLHPAFQPALMQKSQYEVYWCYAAWHLAMVKLILALPAPPTVVKWSKSDSNTNFNFDLHLPAGCPEQLQVNNVVILTLDRGLGDYSNVVGHYLWHGISHPGCLVMLWDDKKWTVDGFKLPMMDMNLMTHKLKFGLSPGFNVPHQDTPVVDTSLPKTQLAADKLGTRVLTHSRVGPWDVDLFRFMYRPTPHIANYLLRTFGNRAGNFVVLAVHVRMRFVENRKYIVEDYAACLHTVVKEIRQDTALPIKVYVAGDTPKVTTYLRQQVARLGLEILNFPGIPIHSVYGKGVFTAKSFGDFFSLAQANYFIGTAQSFFHKRSSAYADIPDRNRWAVGAGVANLSVTDNKRGGGCVCHKDLDYNYSHWKIEWGKGYDAVVAELAVEANTHQALNRANGFAVDEEFENAQAS